MDKCSLVCGRYSQRIGNEVGWLEKVIQDGITSINARATPYGKLPIAILNKQAYFSAHRMQVVYLVNLFEAFMQDFIAAKDGLVEDDMDNNNFWKNYLSVIRSSWDMFCKNKAINNSKSFMNIRYSLFVLKERYNINYPSYLTPLVFELGSLRNCLVHYDGELSNKDKGGYLFKDTLSETLKHLEADDTLERLNDINRNNFICSITYDLQTFIELCGGRISRPIDHNNETKNI